jgi:hypothetical protein
MVDALASGGLRMGKKDLKADNHLSDLRAKIFSKDYVVLRDYALERGFPLGTIARMAVRMAVRDHFLTASKTSILPE